MYSYLWQAKFKQIFKNILIIIIPLKWASQSLTWKKTKTEHSCWFDGKQVPTSGCEKKESRLQNRVYKHGELLLYRWLNKPCE